MKETNEKKEPVKISLSTFFLIIAVLAIIIMGCFIYFDKDSSNKKISELEKNNAELKNSMGEMQDKLNNVSQIVSGENTTNNNAKTETTESKTTTNNSSSTQQNTVTATYADVTDKVEGVGNIDKSNYSGCIYYIEEDAVTPQARGFKVYMENTKVYFKLEDKKLMENVSDSIKRKENEKVEITGFNGKVKKIYFYDEGQALEKEYCGALFEMEDGSVEYILLKDLLENDKLTSKGKLEGINNVKNVVRASVSDYENGEGMGGWCATLIVDNNNHYYDVGKVIRKEK